MKKPATTPAFPQGDFAAIDEAINKMLGPIGDVPSIEFFQLIMDEINLAVPFGGEVAAEAVMRDCLIRIGALAVCGVKAMAIRSARAGS